MKILDWLAGALSFALIFVAVLLLLRAFDVPFLLSEAVALLCAAHSGYWTVRSIRQERAKRIAEEEEHRRACRQCAKCEYDLTGNTTGRCPECGHPVTKET